LPQTSLPLRGGILDLGARKKARPPKKPGLAILATKPRTDLFPVRDHNRKGRGEEAAAVRPRFRIRLTEGIATDDAFGKSADEPSGVTASLASTETFHWTTSFLKRPRPIALSQDLRQWRLIVPRAAWARTNSYNSIVFAGDKRQEGKTTLAEKNEEAWNFAVSGTEANLRF
jgi:hypothetical protein